MSARITNLYGPGQNLGKNQGLVSAIIKAQLTGEPLPLRAAPETTRDYIYARDCARMVVAAMEAVRSRTRGRDPYVCKIVASGRHHGRACRAVAHTPPAQSAGRIA